MSVRDTSLSAYRAALKSGRIGRMQAIVHSVLDKHKRGLTDAELAVAVAEKMQERVPINRITGRRGELVKRGLIYDAGKRMCSVNKTNRMVHVWKTA